MSHIKDKIIEDEGRAEVLRKGTTTAEIIFEKAYCAFTLPDIYKDVGDAVKPFRNSDGCFHIVITKVE